MSNDLEVLKSQIKGELYWDNLHKSLYATDASLYQIKPIAIAIPKCDQDIKYILSFCNRHNIPLTPRGSATSLAGQTVGSGIILDMNKYYNQIIEINTKEEYAVVQPGVYRDTLNGDTEQHGLHFAPDPATSSRASFGGMIANNSSGTRSILYGKTIDHLISLDLMMYDGSVVTLTTQDINKLDNDIQSNLIKIIRPLIFKIAAEIEAKYPKVMRRVSGYALDEFNHTELWNLSKLICGSEGTLGVILSAKVKLTMLPKKKSISVLHFKDRKGAINLVESICQTGPASVELLDYNVMDAAKNNKKTSEYYKAIIVDDPKAVLYVEYFGETNEQLELKRDILYRLSKNSASFYHLNYISESSSISHALKIRKDGLGLLMNKIDVKKPIAFIEDSCIPLKHLARYTEQIERYCSDLDTKIVLYAHASVGVLHIRPYLDVTQKEDLDKFKKISSYAFDLVKGYGGSWSGEHGDGRVRSFHLRDYYGEKIYSTWKEIKSIFDPKGIFNPNIIVDANDITDNFRTDTDTKTFAFEPQFQYRKENSFETLVNNCTGVGACVKHNAGTMCPSYMATKDEKDSTRGRANILRMAMRGELENKTIVTKEATEALSLCLSCKACKSECPSNVDLAKLKSEYLQLKMDKEGVAFQDKLVLQSSKLSKKLSGPLAPLINWIQSKHLFRRISENITGVSKNRVLPSYEKQSLSQWYKKNYNSKNTNKVALFCDTYINYHENSVGIAAIQLLDDAGYYVELAEVGCCQRPKISNGFLKEAKKEGKETMKNLEQYFSRNIPVLVCEPSCTSALIDDLPDLLAEKGFTKDIRSKVYPIDQFIKLQIQSGGIKRKLRYITQEVFYQKHCHADALWDDSPMITSDENIVHCQDNGCCGMAGAFGYEKDHYPISKTIYQQRVGPSIDSLNKETRLIANGFSCRHQIKDFSNREAKHWVEMVEWV